MKDNILCSGHYRTNRYLEKYNYSQNILLDIFCTDYMVWCYEDYYSNDFNLDVIVQYQPYIDIQKFKNLVADLYHILQLVKHSKLIL